MLIKLMPEQVTEYWDTIYPYIDKSLPPITHKDDYRGNDILEDILINNMQCWIISNGDSFENIDGVLTTSITRENIAKLRYLLIYTIFAVDVLNRRVWIDIYRTLRKYAKGVGCSRLSFYTNVPGLVNLTKDVRFADQSTFVVLDLSATEKELQLIGGD